MVYIPGSEPTRGPDVPITPPSPQQPVSPPPQYAPILPPRKRRTGLIVGLVVAAVVVLVGAGVVVLGLTGHTPISVPGVSRGFQVRGMLTVANCDSLGYDDIQAGTEVTITDESGKVLAVGKLNGGAAHCNFPFVIDNVPPGEKFYGITISHRGTLHYTEAQMRQELDLTLG
jgi:hypothetical protein